MKRRFITLVQIFLGVALLLLLIRKIGFSVLLSTMASIPFRYFAYLFFLYLLTILIGAINIHLLLRSILPGVPFRSLFISYNLSSSLSLLFPGKFGELSLLYYLKKDQVPLGNSAAVLFVDKFITLIVICLIGFISTWVYYGGAIAAQLGLVSAIIIALFLFAVSWKKSRLLVRRYILRGYASSFRGFFSSVCAFARDHITCVLLNTLLTAVRWVVRGLFVYVTFLGLGVQPPFIPLLLILALETLVSYVPITINGLGTKHALAVYAYTTLLAIQPNYTLSRLFIGHFIRYGYAALVFFLFRKTKL